MEENNTLKEKLTSFAGSTGKDAIEVQFKKVAQAAFSGHFIVNEGIADQEFSVYLYNIEFYYHDERESETKDRIMYHRNKKNRAEFPYLPVMSLLPHRSGVDVTFENEERQFRASFLIRGYYIPEDTKDPDNKNCPTTLLEDFYGYALRDEHGCPMIKWVDDDICFDIKKIYSGKRINTHDDKKWRFCRYKEDLKKSIEQVTNNK